MTDEPPPTLSGGVIGKTINVLLSRRHLRRTKGKLAHALATLADDGSRVAVQVTAPHLLPLASAATSMLGIGGVWDMPNTLSGRYAGINRTMYRRWCRVGSIIPLANSGVTAASLGGDVAVVPPMTDETLFDPARFSSDDREARRRDLRLEPTDIALAMIARLVPEKGFLQMARANRRARAASAAGRASHPPRDGRQRVGGPGAGVA